MEYLIGLLIFVVLSQACWFVSVAMNRSTFDGPDPRLSPDYETTAFVAVGAVTSTCFLPFYAGTSPGQ